MDILSKQFVITNCSCPPGGFVRRRGTCLQTNKTQGLGHVRYVYKLNLHKLALYCFLIV